jgi:4-amino-4-deoxy-L-arabinose transferase-like glycosyltransferase
MACIVTQRPRHQPRLTHWVAIAVAVHLALHLYVLATTQFGVHRDEFLYFSMGRHLRFWSMDFPPFIAVLANTSRALFGDSLASARIFPMLEGAALIILGALVARELGGGRFAQLFTATAILAAPLFLRSSTLFQPVVLDQLWWTLALFGVVRMIRTEDARWWLLVGAALGFGLLTKFSIAFIGVGIGIALLLTPYRRTLGTPWPWIAAALALAIGSASVIGQVRLGFPLRGQMSDLQSTQLARVTWWSFVTEQPLMLGLITWIVAVVGAVALIVRQPLSRYRAVGIACVAAFVLLMAMHGKSYYAGPIYPTLTAAGAVVLERMHRPILAPTLRATTFALVIIMGIVALPLGVPLLTPAATARYAARLGVTSAVRTNRGVVDRLPQDYADMLGWQAQAQTLGGVYQSLSADEQREAVIIAGNYGEAGAAEFYANRYRLPPVVSPAGSFWFFGPGDRAGRTAIVIGEPPPELLRLYGDVRNAAHIVSPWSVAEERELDVLVARQPKTTLQALWPALAGHH